LIQIAVVDDEKIIREQIRKLAEKKRMESWVDTYSSGEEFLIAKKDYDIIFLDIQMDGMNGIEVAKKIREGNAESVLIFITGIKEYVFEAFDVSAFHYLLKPIEEKKFCEVLERAVAEAEKLCRRGTEQLFIKTRNRNIILNQSSILYIENRGKKVEIHTIEDVIEMYAAMRELEKQLGAGFYRCHRGYLVNMAFITEYSSDNITLQNGESIFLAKERYSEFVKVYMCYLRNGGTVYA